MFVLVGIVRECKKTAAIMETGKSLNKRFNKQNNGCARTSKVFINFFASFAK